MCVCVLVGEEDGDLLETINNLRWELWRKLRGLVVICQVPGHAKGVGGISAVAMVDAAKLTYKNNGWLPTITYIDFIKMLALFCKLEQHF